MSLEPGAGPGTPASAFAELLRSHRQSRGMTQEEFAAAAGVGVRTLRDLERARARPQRSTVDLLAAALGLTGADRLEFVLAARRGSGTDAMIEVRDGVNLPPAPVLIGRDAELASLDVALRHAALVTLVGVAGVGKTSLGWTAAHLAAPRHPGGVAGIAITEVSTEADILATVATVFDVPRIRDLPGHLAGRPALLLVDAVDRAADATSAALRWLQGIIPSLRIIATGRHPTRIPGEYVWPVGPLETPQAGIVDLAEIARYPAAQLFLDRLRAVGRTELGPDDVAAVAELVRRLGGLPLALELAAARARILAVPEILNRYGDRVLDLGGNGDLATPLRPGGELPRRDASAARCRLLDPADRWALRRLASFAYRWSAELAEPLLADGPGGTPDIVVLLDRLAGLGLLSVRVTGTARFRLLDMVREFGREEAQREGEATEAARRHAEVFARYAVRTAPDLVGRTLPTAADRLTDVASDLRAALVWSTQADPRLGLRLAAALPRWGRFPGAHPGGREGLRRPLGDPRTAGAAPAGTAGGHAAPAPPAA